MANRVIMKSMLWPILVCWIYMCIPSYLFAQLRDNYTLGTTARTYQRFFGDYSWPSQSSGVFTGTFTNPNAFSSSYDFFHGFGYTKHIDVCIPYTDQCIYSHDYGATINWDFNATGPINYTYNIPFEVSFSMPTTVFPGQRIYLTPTFTWASQGQNPGIATTQDYEYSHVTSAWMDAPFDGLDDLSIRFTQYATKANLDLEFPVLPFLPSVPLNVDLTCYPFNTGGGSWNGSYTKLGGTGTLPNSGAIAFNLQPTEIYVGAPASISPSAWRQGHELFELTASVLLMIPTPATIAAGAALDFVRAAGDFELRTELDGSIARQDVIGMMISDLPYVDVPTSLTAGDSWTFSEIPVAVKYKVYGWSSFWFPMGYNITFDMVGIDPKQILHEDLLWVAAGGATTEWIDQEGVFKITGRVPVVKRDQYPDRLRLDATQRLDSTAQPNKTRMSFQSVPGGVHLSDSRALLKKVHISERVYLPQPTVAQGKPALHHYTVILGATPSGRATRVIEALRTKGIKGFAVPLTGSANKLLTLGSFSDEKQAKTLAGMMKEIFNLDGVVTKTTVQPHYTPLGEEIVARIRK